MLHRIWQDKHKYPHEVYALDRQQKTFIYASESLVIEIEEEEKKEQERQRQKGGI